MLTATTGCIMQGVPGLKGADTSDDSFSLPPLTSAKTKPAVPPNASPSANATQSVIQPVPVATPSTPSVLSAVEAGLNRLAPNSWAPFTPMIKPRMGLVAADGGDRLYAIGGDGIFTDETYQFSTGLWTRFNSSIAGLRHNLYFMGGVTVASNTVLLGGIPGDEGAPNACGLVLPFDNAHPPETPSALLSLPNYESLYGMGVALLDGVVYVAGGRNMWGVQDGCYKYSELTPPAASSSIFDPGNARCAVSFERLKHPRAGLGLVGVSGTLYAIGGYTMTYDEVLTAQNTVQLCLPTSVSWIASGELGGPPAMPTKRYNFGTAVVKNKIYVIGGIGEQGRCLRTVEIYDTTTAQWSTGTPMPTARSALSVVVHQGQIFALGGVEADGRASRVVEVYAP